MWLAVDTDPSPTAAPGPVSQSAAGLGRHKPCVPVRQHRSGRACSLRSMLAAGCCRPIMPPEPQSHHLCPAARALGHGPAAGAAAQRPCQPPCNVRGGLADHARSQTQGKQGGPHLGGTGAGWGGGWGVGPCHRLPHGPHWLRTRSARFDGGQGCLLDLHSTSLRPGQQSSLLILPSMLPDQPNCSCVGVLPGVGDLCCKACATSCRHLPCQQQKP